ncbi:MAG: metallophosphoesterase [Pseudomonadota bacterium]
MFTRRTFLKTLGLTAFGSLGLGGYAFGIEPMRVRVTRYTLTPSNWPQDLRLRIVALADIHACDPWMSVDRIYDLCNQANELEPDLIVLLGDYAAGHRFVVKPVHSRDWSAALGSLSAPLGVHAVLGNHDWWDDPVAQRNGRGPVFGQRALERVGIPVYENDVVRLSKDGQTFWLAGLGDQLAFLPSHHWGPGGFRGVDDLDGMLEKVTDQAPIVLLAHEPDIFAELPDEIALTLAGHTHGGQVRFFGHAPVVPSRFGNRYAYGTVTEPALAGNGSQRHMIVSGGLGCSVAPIRFGMPPEIVQVDLGLSFEAGKSG